MAMVSNYEYLDYARFQLNTHKLIEDVLRSMFVSLHTTSKQNSGSGALHNNIQNANVINGPRLDMTVDDIKAQYQKKILSLNYLGTIPYFIKDLISIADPKNPSTAAPTQYYMLIMAQMTLGNGPDPASVCYDKRRDENFVASEASRYIYQPVVQFHKTCELALRVRIMERLIQKFHITPNLIEVPMTRIVLEMEDLIAYFIELFYGFMMPVAVSVLYASQRDVLFSWTALIEKFIAAAQRSCDHEKKRNNPFLQGYMTAIGHLQNYWARNTTRETLGSNIAAMEELVLKDIGSTTQTLWNHFQINPMIRNMILNCSTGAYNEWKSVHGNNNERPHMNSIANIYHSKYNAQPLEFAYQKRAPNLNKDMPEKGTKPLHYIDLSQYASGFANTVVSTPNAVNPTNMYAQNPNMYPTGALNYNVGNNAPSMNMPPSYYNNTPGQQQMYGPMVNAPQQPQQPMQQPQPYGLYPTMGNVPQQPQQPMTLYNQLQTPSSVYSGLNTTPAIGVMPNPVNMPMMAPNTVPQMMYNTGAVSPYTQPMMR